VKVSVDTTVLVRAVLQDDVKQARMAGRLLKEATLIAVSLVCLCELAWVLRGAKLSKEDVSAAIQSLMATRNVVMNRPAAEAGLAMLDAGGDFADGVLAYEGTWLGGETFASFGKRAVDLLLAQGQTARLLT
jgi:predicted nucleic-acid-binding protein